MACASAVIFFSGCSDDNNVIPDPDPFIDSLICVEDLGGQAVGPGGGIVTFTDSTFHILDLEMEFQPGGIDHFLCFRPWVYTPHFTSYFPR